MCRWADRTAAQGSSRSKEIRYRRRRTDYAILSVSSKPGRDPRAEFKYATFKEDGNRSQGWVELEGIVTNVANFGAFVDVGVHQDGLVHISQLADRFVDDPADRQVGQVVKVRVLSQRN